MHRTLAKSILSPSNGMNVYRGCTHGCIYCDSRSLCYRMDHDFEDVEVKANALDLLEAALKRKRRRCMLACGSMSDPYMPLEAETRMVRGALSLALEHGFGFTLITKSDLVLRDLDLLKAINRKAKCVVQMTLTTFDDGLCRKIEPGVCPTSRRAEVLRVLRDNGIPTIVWLCPILPFINDTEENVRGILEICADAGVKGVVCFGMGLTLRDGSREHFYSRLDELFPGMKDRYIRAFRDSYVVPSPNNEQLMSLFHRFCESRGMMHDNDQIFEYLRRLDDKTAQTRLSDEWRPGKTRAAPPGRYGV
ncbi:MAG: radical SAM protein [Candidatus Methanomethylophilaceae archaeon]|nr:radical SAM protein [Candidatus Methanomethylophilaceae archaeon]